MNCLHVPHLLMPKEGTDLYRWSVIACDQYTSQPEYWEETQRIVGDAPSTLRLTLPEVYLGEDGEEERIRSIHQTMERYLDDGTLRELPAGFMLVKRTLGENRFRCGLVVEIDLETYAYQKGSDSPVRPTEMTVEERIPPRLRVRQTASLELPHIMLLIDDPEESILEPLLKRTGQFEQVYDTGLMQQGGHISGWLIPEGEETKKLMEQIEELAQADRFHARYDLQTTYPLLNLAVGDGNHSMATAKAAWEKKKLTLSKQEQEQDPARYCLCEIVNVHDPSLFIEPIHRVLFEVDRETLFAEAAAYYEQQGCEFVLEEGTCIPSAGRDEHRFAVFSEKGVQTMRIKHPVCGIAVASLQGFLDVYLEKHSDSRIDYIHGADVVERLGTQEGNLGFLLPEIDKEDLFRGVIMDGVLPRKTFSMGEANEKRYYMECKRLI
ncbi:MAG: DUF1015 domain-containing protein [Lachnospiraceae bacterium]|nr:DUF1015 domain-containing protein [Lachnospiraceae bacterium]